MQGACGGARALRRVLGEAAVFGAAAPQVALGASGCRRFIDTDSATWREETYRTFGTFHELLFRGDLDTARHLLIEVHAR